MKSLGVFGGTFAPIHSGHLRLAIELKERLQLERVHIIPNARPPHRAIPEVPPQRRLEWARLAVGDEPGLFVDDREVRRALSRSEPSYTYDTLVELRHELGDAPLYLLLGDDAANNLHTWHQWRELFDLAHLIFVERPFEPPAPPAELNAFLRGRKAQSAEALRAQPGGLWLPLSVPPLAISSTRIRRLLKAGRSIRGLVPDAVIHSLTPQDVLALTHDEDPAYD
ncbi:MAG: nicotinate-nucleotide adenylyltransferase [Nevskia sp.]|jgi:nicotinate-nucleotide adenylyltransferase|nr:nicotinate-nucleotide adenylyltransferase [Nevskia sp.]MCK9384239.1 nicotinate-nucleotide adenylyltransferase [Nevskia sp.]